MSVDQGIERGLARFGSADVPAENEPLASAPFVRLTAANTLFFLCFASFFLLPVWLKQLGAGESAIGLVMAAGPAASMFMMPLTAALVNRWGRRLPFLFVGYVGLAAVAFAFSRIDSLDLRMMLGLRIAAGLCFGIAFTAANIFVADVVPASRLGQGIGLFGVFILVSHMLGPALAEPLANRHGFPAVFAMAAVLPLVALTLLPPESSAPARHTGETGGPWRPLRSPGFRAVLALTLVTGGGFGAVLTYVPAYAEQHDIKPVATFFVAYSVAAIAMRLVAGRLTDVDPRVRVIAPSSVGYVFALVLIPYVTSWESMACVGALFGASHGLMYPAACALALERVGGEQRASAMALYNLGFNVGATVTIVVAGVLVDHFGYGSTFAWIATVVGLVACGFVLREITVLQRSRP